VKGIPNGCKTTNVIIPALCPLEDPKSRQGHCRHDITNHAYLDNPTFRGMRQSLLKTFNEIYILDLHGSSKRGGITPDGSRDENVFDIQQGVSIVISDQELFKIPFIRDHHSLFGLRSEK
jgi:predicted helicase